MGTHDRPGGQFTGLGSAAAQQPGREPCAVQRGLGLGLPLGQRREPHEPALHRIGVAEVPEQQVLGELREFAGLCRLLFQQRSRIVEARCHAGKVGRMVVPRLVDEVAELRCHVTSSPCGLGP